MTDLKNSIKNFNSKFNQAEERTNEQEDRLFEIIQLGEQKEKRMKKSEENLCDLWDTIKKTNLCIIGISEGEDREKGGRKLIQRNKS